MLLRAQLAAFADTWAPAQVNLVLVLLLEALHLCDQVAARRQTLPLLPPASLNYACACLLPLLFLRRPPRRCGPNRNFAQPKCTVQGAHAKLQPRIT